MGAEVLHGDYCPLGQYWFPPYEIVTLVVFVRFVTNNPALILTLIKRPLFPEVPHRGTPLRSGDRTQNGQKNILAGSRFVEPCRTAEG
jgi:hypothetical protein